MSARKMRTRFQLISRHMNARRYPAASDAVIAFLQGDGQHISPSTHEWSLAVQASIRWRKKWLFNRKPRVVRVALAGTLPSIWLADLDTLGLGELRPYPEWRFLYNARQGCLTISGNSDLCGGTPCLIRLRHASIEEEFRHESPVCNCGSITKAEVGAAGATAHLGHISH